MKILLSIIFFLTLFHFVSAQEKMETTNVEDTSKVIIHQDKRIEDLINFHILLNEKNKGKGIKGFRIQLAQDSKRDLVLEKKAEFSVQFPNIKNYLTYQQPYFKLRVGNFRTRLEAEKAMIEISILFEGAFIVNDDIQVE